MVRFVLLLAACSGAQPPGPVAEDPIAPSDGGPPEGMPSEPTDPNTACGLVFTEDDAQDAYARLAKVEAECEFEGVTVRAWRMAVRFKKGDDIVDAYVAAESCAEGTTWATHDGLALWGPDATKTACPKAYDGVSKLVTAGELPKPRAPGS